MILTAGFGPPQLFAPIPPPRIPDAPDEEPGCFDTYKLAGTIDNKPFICKVAFERDGRDAEYDHIAGENIYVTTNPDAWDAMLSSWPQDLQADMLAHMN